MIHIFNATFDWNNHVATGSSTTASVKHSVLARHFLHHGERFGWGGEEQSGLSSPMVAVKSMAVGPSALLALARPFVRLSWFDIWSPININKMQTWSCCGQAFLINNSPLLNSRKFCLGWANPLSYALTNVKRNPEPNLSYIIHFGPPKKMGTVHPLKWEVFTKWCSLLIPCGFASASIPPPACIRMRCRSTGGFGQSGGRGGHRQGGRTFGTFASCSCGENWVANEKMRQQIRDVRKHDVPVRL